MGAIQHPADMFIQPDQIAIGIGEAVLALSTAAALAYFIFIRRYLADPGKEAKDSAWLIEWEKCNRPRQIEIERRRPSIDDLFWRFYR